MKSHNLKFAIRVLLFGIFIAVLNGCGPDIPGEVETASKNLPETIDYNIHVKPILSDRCFACHGPDKANQKAGLRLDLGEDAFSELPESPGKYAIVPGKLGKSELIHRILHTDPEISMPPPESNLNLNDYEKAVLIKWIEEGAEYKPHWAFIKPKKAALQKNESANPIDYFITAELNKRDWQLKAEADKETLLRRVSLDLTGLPPRLSDIEAFLEDDSPDAYEKAVDRLLSAPEYGERMAVEWMDVSRFADTHGYTVDRYRDMSPWRDWVIKAFNENMPYDQFVTWQMAGDMLEDPTREQILATGFNRNHQQNMEGGIVPEEFRVEYVADRTNTLGAAFLGLTLECARCHDHKYDPVSQKEYYQLFSFFNNVREAGQISWDNATPVPTLLLTSEETEKQLAFLKDKVEQTAGHVQDLIKDRSGFQSWLEKGRFSTKGQYPEKMTAHFDLNKAPIANRLNPRQKAIMKQQTSNDEKPEFVPGRVGQGLVLNGDTWLGLGDVGVFDRATPFSVGIWVNLPEELENGVIFHKGDGAALYNFRGYHLALKDNRLEVLMARTTPYNAIIEYADNIPRNQWIHLMMTYDGSSKAAGLKVYLNGKELPTEIETDNLYKDILFPGRKQPGLQIGARWRGIGIKGARVDDIMVFNKELASLEVLQVFDPATFMSQMKKSTDELNQNDQKALYAYYLTNQHRSYQKELTKLSKERKSLNATIDTIREIMVMDEMETPRPAFILERGQYDTYGEQVHPSTPESILAFPEEYPKNRLGMARWLFHPDHPLTARVTVNRYWQMLFGRGLVKTAEDFGNQGDLPSHPELLDWLSVEFRESGWDVKALLKLMVMSATYRQSSIPDPEIAEADPDNVWLASGPSGRLSAEMLRDQALAASGLLVQKIGGKSVKPYQPEGLWRVNNARYQPDKGEALYRRSLYTFWKRTVPHPTQGTFDAPTRSLCTVRRQETNTPLQALVLLNDPTFAEAAKVIGEKIAKASNLSDAIQETFTRITGRNPLKGELELLLELQQEEYNKFISAREKTTGWLKVGEYDPDPAVEPELLASCTVVASTIFNADAALVKR